MSGDGKFGFQETLWLLVITISAKLFFTTPAMAVQLVGTAAWYMPLISGAVASIGFTFIYLLLKRYPGSNIMEIYNDVFGRFLGFIFSFLLAVTLLASAAINLREFAEIQRVYVLQKTPISFLIGVFTAMVVFMTFFGLEAVARYSKIISFALVTALIIILILSFQHYQVHRLFPLLGHGLEKTIYYGVLRSSGLGEVIVVAVIAKHLHGIKEIKKAGFSSILLSTTFVLVSYIAFLLTFSYYVARELTAPMYVMSSLISYGAFFQRVESIFLFIWNLSSIVSVIVLFTAAMIVYCNIFRINDKKPLIIPFGIILFSLSMIPGGIMDVIKTYKIYVMNYGWTMFYIPPLIALIAAVLFKKKGVAKNA